MAVIIQSKQLYIKPVYSTAVHKSVYSTAVHKTSLQYSYTQNQFKVQLYTTIYGKAVHKTNLQISCTQNQFTELKSFIHKTWLEHLLRTFEVLVNEDEAFYFLKVLNKAN